MITETNVASFLATHRSQGPYQPCLISRDVSRCKHNSHASQPYQVREYGTHNNMNILFGLLRPTAQADNACKQTSCDLDCAVGDGITWDSQLCSGACGNLELVFGENHPLWKLQQYIYIYIYIYI